jgi:hypothetical protein
MISNKREDSLLIRFENFYSKIKNIHSFSDFINCQDWDLAIGKKSLEY